LKIIYLFNSNQETKAHSRACTSSFLKQHAPSIPVHWNRQASQCTGTLCQQLLYSAAVASLIKLEFGPGDQAP